MAAILLLLVVAVVIRYLRINPSQYKLIILAKLTGQTENCQGPPPRSLGTFASGDFLRPPLGGPSHDTEKSERSFMTRSRAACEPDRGLWRGVG